MTDETRKALLTKDDLRQSNPTIREITIATDNLTLMADRMGLDFGDEGDEDE